MFDTADYQRAATRLNVPVAHVMAMAAVESSGETFWALNGQRLVPVRFEAHWFGKLTGYRFNESHPDLSCVSWNPALAAPTRAGAWDQLERARVLDRDAANQAASWGAFQIMGFHWQRLGYPSVQAFVDSMSADGDDGQMDAFVKFIEADPALHASLAIGAWDDVERRYNGGGQGGAYARKLEAAAARYAASDTTPPEAGIPVSTPAPRILRKGDSGPDVAALQAALFKVDGQFGAITDAALRQFQRGHGLVPDGIAGPQTRAALGL